MKKLILFVACLIISNLACFAQSFPWNVPGDDSGFQYNMNICGIVKIDDVEQFSLTLAVGAFVGEECRGAVYPYVYEGHIEYWITIQGDTPGETITFKLYDSENDKVLDLDCTCSYDFEIDGMIGLDEHFIFSFTSPITGYTLDITGYNEEQGNGSNWYLISTPVGTVNPAEIEGMTTDDFDLYYFNQRDNGAEWKNYESTAFSLEPCKGYLYAHSTNVTLNFGTEAYSGSGNVTLVKDDNANLAGWNLIGNPFGETAYIGRDFYVMNPEGSEIVPAETDQIAPMQGIFVVAERDGETVTFTPGAGTDDGNKLVINVAQNRSGVIDRAIVRFGQGGQLPKFMLNEDNTKIYIPQADNEYAVVRSDNEAELPLNFKAAANGTYILKVDANTTEMDYLHLIDNKTGNDINLLENPSYTFEASATDFANRFKLVLRNTTSIDENTNFAFYNGLDWTVNNEGKSTLQVVDMTGRIVSTETIDGTAHVTINAAPGAYMLQLTNGNDVKTQKVVIK